MNSGCGQVRNRLATRQIAIDGRAILLTLTMNFPIEMSECLVTDCSSHEAIDDALRIWLDITAKLRFRASDSQFDFLTSAEMLLESEIFKENKEYVRTQIIHSLLQEDEAGPLYAIASLLFLDGCTDESIFPCMVEESCFPRLLELIIARSEEPDPDLHRVLLQLMYEMSRVQRLKVQDLALVDDAFVHYLFGIIEGVSDDVQDPYHYPTIRVLVSSKTCPRSWHFGVRLGILCAIKQRHPKLTCLSLF